ncbi:hypothetical protein B0H67DRAFT_551998 [Lasiosphaeris hirsuta]|uniref:C2H2-type domain-containing protein n=1 Tax=Lasiosphaeris hirsuta TaxID=260670 RepID=A0AA40APN0_9PEZI|nr:hypothetical protein B0H67DRAFT_551998 [Lasiosphaeris hirsuta]
MTNPRMANQYSTFTSAAYIVDNGAAYHSSYLFPQVEESLHNIDPNLQSHFPVQPVREYLQNPQRTTVFDIDVPMDVGASVNYHMHQEAIRPHLGLPSQARHGSPFSAIEQSTISGGTHNSPRADTESCRDPATPPDTTYSPYLQNPQKRHWNTAASALDFAGMGPQCVNLNDINPSQDYPEESDQLNFDFFTYSLGSHGSQYDPAAYPAAEEIHIKRANSPGAMQSPIKDEIQAASSQYPPLGDDHEPDEESSPVASNRKAEESDEEYQEPVHSRHTTARSTPRQNTRKRPAVATESPASKKRKTNISATQQQQQQQQQQPQPQPQLSQVPPQLASSQRQLPSNSSVNSSQLKCPDSTCKGIASFADQTLLDAHIKKKHTRPYPCVFHFAGCDSTFASKNEWKRHCSSQHILQHYWICQEKDCINNPNGACPIPTNSMAARASAVGSKARASSSTPNNTGEPGAIFNRKDLYTQHMRRMHMPAGLKNPPPPTTSKKSKKATASSNADNVWNQQLHRFQEEAIRARCSLPIYMTCPAANCDSEFRGADAWDLRMEHVAKHCDGAAQGREPKVVFGGEGDECLTEWAGSGEVDIVQRVGGRWVLTQKGKAAKGGATEGRGVFPSLADAGASVKREVEEEIVAAPAVDEDEDEDEDADGEDEDVFQR